MLQRIGFRDALIGDGRENVQRITTRRSSLLVLVLLAALIGLLVPASSQGALIHEYVSRITEIPTKGPPPAEETVGAPGPLTTVYGIAADGGSLYLADRFSESRLDQFDASSGAFISQFANDPSAFDLRQSVAVGHSTGETEIYVTGDETIEGTTTGIVAAFSGSGALQRSWSGTPEGHFACFECNGQAFVAVDNSANPLSSGDIYVSDPEHGAIDVFEAKAGGEEQYLAKLTGPEAGVSFASITGVAASSFNGDLIVAEHEALDILEPGPLHQYTLITRLTGTPAGPFQQLSAVAVDGGNGEVFVVNNGRSRVNQFSAAGAYRGDLLGTGTPAGAFGGLGGVAVDAASHNVYVGDSDRENSFLDIFGPNVTVPDTVTEPVSNLEAHSATLDGTVNPDEAGEATCRFAWGTTASLGNSAPCEPEAVPNGNAPVHVHAVLQGLEPDTIYYYRLQATNEADGATNPGEDFETRHFTTPGSGIHFESASGVTSSSATLNARIDPNGTPTSYYFQYGTSASYEASVPTAPGVEVGSASGDQGVSVHLQQLAPATTYHFRVVSVSHPPGETVVTEGDDRTFTTQGTGGAVALPDGRAWEMVTPAEKHGADLVAVGSEQGGDIQAAVQGGAITYIATSSTEANPAGSRPPEPAQIISRRERPGVWSTSDITTPHTEGATELSIGFGPEYKQFSANLSAGLVEPEGDTPLPPLPAGSEKTMYLRLQNGEYRAIVTTANVRPGVAFGGDKELHGGVKFVDGSSDLSHLILLSKIQLTAEPYAPEAFNLYEWSGGSLQVVSVLPNGQSVGARLGYLGDETNGIAKNALSSDGSRVVFEAAGHEYLRDVTAKTTAQIDAAQGAPEPSADVSRYRAASESDSRVFFTNNEPLTAASRSIEGEDLYVFESPLGAGEGPNGHLIDLTVATGAKVSAEVRGVIGASADGSYVYFVANGLLGDAAVRGAQTGDCAENGASPGQACNLYVNHYDAASKSWQAPTFIATLSGADEPSWGGFEQLQGEVNKMTSRVSPNGRYLAFMSERNLTGYDTRDANSGAPDEEVYIYDSSEGRTSCASCNPTGAQPTGLHEGEEYEERLVNYARSWGDRWIAGNLPSWTSKDLANAIYQSNYLENDGRLFFDSADALVPADVNGKEDVYEYEPPGVGGCLEAGMTPSASMVFDARAGGCVALISAGTSSEESAFMDASETGSDVFFITTSHLSSQDFDTSLDMYDAHECTAAAPCAETSGLAPPPCTTGDACKPAPTLQPAIFGTPSSETFSGAGNVEPATPGEAAKRSVKTARAQLSEALRKCHRQSGRHKARCERRARQRYRAKQANARGR